MYVVTIPTVLCSHRYSTLDFLSSTRLSSRSLTSNSSLALCLIISWSSSANCCLSDWRVCRDTSSSFTSLSRDCDREGGRAVNSGGSHLWGSFTSIFDRAAAIFSFLSLDPSLLPLRASSSCACVCEKANQELTLRAKLITHNSLSPTHTHTHHRVIVLMSHNIAVINVIVMPGESPPHIWKIHTHTQTWEYSLQLCKH